MRAFFANKWPAIHVKVFMLIYFNLLKIIWKSMAMDMIIERCVVLVKRDACGRSKREIETCGLDRVHVYYV